eukprot:TRINITY_DN7090_c0_g1_i1.p1 TRINITY_DN7090_c0_g1~~TRINITY_DN7090_c0_g1_i1.p1  ORF type:complete len:812 (-),score=137.18 TRINITY_DN7090_c0_g1_i1:340-2775(-)
MSLELRRAVSDAHDKPVLCVAYSPFHRELYTGSEDGRIIVWDRESGRQLRVLSEHRGWVTGLFYHAETKMLFSCSVDGRLLVWNFAGAIVQSEDLHTPCYCMAWESRRQQLIIGCNGEIRTFAFIKEAFDPNRKEVLKKLFVVGAHTDVVRAIICFEGKIYSASYDRAMCIYDSENPKRYTLVPNRHAAGITLLAFDSDNNWIISGSFDRTIRVWSLDCKLLHRFDNFEDSVTGLCYVPATRSLWASTNTRFLVALDLRTTTNITEYIIDKTMERPKEEEDSPLFQRLFWISEAQEMVGWTTSRQLMMWRYNPCVPVSVCRGHSDGIETLCVCQKSTDVRIFSAGGDGLVRKWEPMQLNTQLYSHEVVVTHNGIALCSTFHEGLDLLIVALDDHSIRIIPYELVSQRLTELVRSSANDHSDRVSGLKYVGETLISVSWDCSIRFWDLRKERQGELITMIRNAHDDAIMAVDYCPSTNEIATCGADKIVKLWDFDTQRLRGTIVGHTADINYILWNHVHECWVTGSDDNTIRFWDVHGSQVFELFHTKGEPITAIAYDRNYGFLMIALRDKIMRLYDPKRSEVIHSYTGHTDEIRGIIHIPELHQYVTASWDRTLRVWHAYRDKIYGRTRKALSAPGSLQNQDLLEEDYRPYELDHPLTQPKTLNRIGVSKPLIEKTNVQERKPKGKRKKGAEDKKAQNINSSLVSRLNDLEASLSAKDPHSPSPVATAPNQHSMFGQRGVAAASSAPGSRGATSKGISRSQSIIAHNVLPSISNSTGAQVTKPHSTKAAASQRTLPVISKGPLVSQPLGQS